MIEQALLTETATFIEQKISKVVLNNNLDIYQFEVKHVDQSSVVLNYLVEASQISHIQLIELRDAAGTVLTSNNVSVPIASDTLMLQTIHVREGA